MGKTHPESIRLVTADLWHELDNLTLDVARLAAGLPSTIEELDQYSPEDQKRLIRKKMQIENTLAHLRQKLHDMPKANGGAA